MAEEQTHKDAEEKAPSTVEQKAPDVAVENAPSTSEAEATSIPTANTPDPEAANSADNPNAAKPVAAKKPPKAAEDGKPAAKAKKEKAPALEDKPFAEYIQQDFLPALKAGLAKQGIPDAELVFETRKVDVIGFSQLPACPQVIGHWSSGSKQSRQFNLYFFDSNIAGQKGFSYAESGGRSSTLESFRIDERKVDLVSLVFWTVQRLNAQKWLVRN